MDANKRTFWYALYSSESPLRVNAVEEPQRGGATLYETGENVVTYSAPVECRANISPAGGSTMVELFGNDERYDKILAFDENSFPPIDENSVLCIDKTPSYDAHDRLIYDYVVRKVAKSLHHVFVAVSKVAVS